jgi:large subunit ribosomal protein L18
MSIKNKKELRRFKIKHRIRKQISGTVERPRLTVFRSNKEIFAQIVNDVAGVTLAAASTMSKDIEIGKITKIEQAKLVGQAIAKKAIEAGVTSVVFDRNGYLYHGRVKALADAAREGGLIF